MKKTFLVWLLNKYSEFINWLLEKAGIIFRIKNIERNIQILETSTEFLINNYDKRLRWKLKRILTNTRSPFYFKKIRTLNGELVDRSLLTGK